MIRSPRNSLLLVLALLLGQWAFAAHANSHPLSGPEDPQHEAVCVLCLQGASLEELQLCASQASWLTPAASQAAAAAAPGLGNPTSPAASIRGPPSILQI